MRTRLSTFALMAFCTLGAGHAPTAVAQDAVATEAAPQAAIPLEDGQSLQPGDGLGWKWVTNGEVKQVILPAFHPEWSHPIQSGNNLAYVGLTKNGDRHQLGCITYDLAKGKVLNRQDSSLFARDGQALSSPRIDNGVATCVLKGERCGKDGARCSAAEETVALNFLPGALAKKDLKGKKHHTKSHGKSRAANLGHAYRKPVTPEGKARSASAHSTARKAAHP
ncbi:MAG: hypothetical protein EKK46_05935 [Rhodocyclaceae bacterium]|nr:MAG: hypothetical protein EKK46_05935 [Rhodocyclaceae bacterium]